MEKMKIRVSCRLLFDNSTDEYSNKTKGNENKENKKSRKQHNKFIPEQISKLFNVSTK
jgi:hypothetical protein